MSKVFEVMSGLENEQVQLEKALAVLYEAGRYLGRSLEPGSFEARFFIDYERERTNLLLCVADGLLLDMRKSLAKATDELHKIHKERKGEER